MSTLATYNLKHPDAAGDQITFTSDGDINFDNGAVYLDSSNNRLGIGTTAPVSDAVLTLSTDSDTALFFRRGSGTNQDGAIRFEGGDFQFLNGANSSTVAGLEERMRIDSDGNVGIGTVNPQSLLEVNDSENNLQARFGSLTAGVDPFIRLQGQADDSTNCFADILLDAENQRLVFNDPGTNSGSIGTNPVSITNAGRLLVNTSTDSGDASLQVDGPIQTGVVRMASHSRSYTASTSATDLFKVRFTGGHGGAEFTYWFVDSAYPNGVRTGKIYMSFRGSGSNITAVSINAANESSVTGGSFTGITFTASVHDVNHIKLTVTGTNTSGSGTMYIYGVSPFFDTLTPITDV